MRCCPHSRVSVLALAAALVALPALAQDGGRIATLDFSQRLEGDRNRNLTPGGDDTEVISTTSLGFSLESVTGIDQLSLSASTVLRGSFGEDAEDFEIADPVLQFGYSRTGAQADFSIEAQTASSDISYLNPFELILNEDGTIDVISDFDELGGTGTRRQSRVSAEANWGKESRLGFGASLSLRDVSYQDVTSDDLNDSQTYSARLNARYDITPVLEASTYLSYAHSQEDGADETQTHGYGVGLTANSGRGRVGANFDVTTTEDDDHRLELSGLWAESLASGGQVSLRLGTVWTASGDGALTAQGNYVKPTPSGELAAQFRRSVSDDSDGDEVLNTAGLVSYSHQVDRLSQVGLEFSYTEAENLDEDTDTRQTEISASYGRELAQNWTAQIGASRIWRDDADGSAESDSLFLQFGRSFSGPF